MKDSFEIKISFLYKLLSFQWEYPLSYFFDNEKIIINKGNTLSVFYSTIDAAPLLKKGLFWDALLLYANGEPVRIPGVKKKSSISSHKSLLQKIQFFYEAEAIVVFNQINKMIKRVRKLFFKRYVKNSEIAKWVKSEPDGLKKKLNNDLLVSFLPKDSQKKAKILLQLLQKYRTITKNNNKKFIKEELNKHNFFFDNVEKNPLTVKQRLSCVINEDNNLIIAGAGAGKTTIIIAKAGYLVESGLASPEEILILAYAKKAQKEIENRVKERLSNRGSFVVKTFHKTGIDIIAEVTGKKPSLTKFEEDERAFAIFIDGMIKKLASEDNHYNQIVLSYFIEYSREYEDSFQYKDEKEYLKALSRARVKPLKNQLSQKKTIQMEDVKSFEEVIIADFLFSNGIDYEYERPYIIDLADETHKQYCPDFYLPEYDIYIEHFGISRDGKTAPYINREQYLKQIEWKRNIHNIHETFLIETYSYEIKEGILLSNLKSNLMEMGVVFNPIPVPLLFEQLRKINKITNVTSLTRLLFSFLRLFKQSGITYQELVTRAKNHQDKKKCYAFFSLFKPILDEYELELAKTNTVDFNDMIRTATHFVQKKKWRSPFRYIFVDEFQDISAIRSNFIKTLRQNNMETVLFCVGDDWQSIYQFSGADIEYIKNFKAHFGATQRVILDQTFRFNNEINLLAKNFISKNPEQIKKDFSSHILSSGDSVYLVGYSKKENDSNKIINLVFNEIRLKMKKGSVFFLGRYSFTKPKQFESIKKKHPEYKIEFHTIHSSKGKEADFVILLDVNNKPKYGFPSKINDDSLLSLVLPKVEPFPFAEERRLFYVAITRAKQSVFLLYDISNPSEFIKELVYGRKNGEFKFNIDNPKFYEIKTCPKCEDGLLIKREGKNGMFWGCSNYDYRFGGCSYTESL